MHEEQRRIQTLNIIANWNNSLKRETRLAEKIVEKFTEQQCKNLYDYNPFYVDKKTHDMICQMCPERSEDCKISENDKNCTACKKNDKGEYLIAGIQLTELRGHVTNYLNNLEIVALAWLQAIADKDTLILQFSYLYTPGTKSALKTYRTIAGNGNSYPALSDFYEEIEKSNTRRTPMKKEQ